MKYTIDTIINAPRAEVLQKFDNPENMKHWQKGFISYEPVSGTPGETGAKAKLKYHMGKRVIEMTETITYKNLPEAFHANYEADGVFNIQENFFEKIDDHTTKWMSISQFKFTSFMMKVIGFLMPGSFKKQSEQYMADFKSFIEKGESVAHENA